MTYSSFMSQKPGPPAWNLKTTKIEQVYYNFSMGIDPYSMDTITKITSA